MGKDSMSKSAGKAKGKAGGGGDENAGGKGKEKGSTKGDGLGSCTYGKARHILSEKQGKVNEAYKKLQDGWLNIADKVLPEEFAKLEWKMEGRVAFGV